MDAWEVLHEAVRDDAAALLRALGGTSVVLLHRDVRAVLRRTGVLHEVLTTANGVVACDTMRDGDDDGDSTAMTWPRAQHLVLVLHPHVRVVRTLVAHVLSYLRQHPTAVPHVWLVPQKTLLLEHVLDKELKLTQAFPQLTLHALDADVCLHARDVQTLPVLSMHLPRAFAQLYADGDVAPLRWVARVLVKLQATLLGTFASMHGKGHRAVQVVQLLRRMQNEASDVLARGGDDSGGMATATAAGVVRLLVLDRTLDLVTPLLTQQTYAGMLDDVYNIDGDEVDLPSATTTTTNSATPSRVMLDEQRDAVYAQLRDLPFAAVGAALYQQSTRVKERYDARRTLHGLKELKQFMQRLPELQEQHRLTAVHTSIATELGKTAQTMAWRRRVSVERDLLLRRHGSNSDAAARDEWQAYMDELVDRKQPLSSVLRLLCLRALTSNGLTPREHDAARDSLMLAYGIPHVLATFAALERCGLLPVQQQPSAAQQGSAARASYAARQRHFRLCANGATSDSDAARAYGVYTPLLVRLVEDFVAAPHAWRAKDAPVHTLLPAEHIALGSDDDAAGEHATTAAAPCVVVVCVVGGVTASELTSLRALQRKLRGDEAVRAAPRLVVVTTDVCTGARLVHSLVDVDAL